MLSANCDRIFRNPFAYRPAPEHARDLAGDEEARYRPIEWPLVRRLLGYLRPYKKSYAIGIAFGIAMVGLEMLSPQFIGRYLAAAGDQVLASVGAYQLEGLGVQLFEKIDGDYFSILGLPLIPLLDTLRREGVIEA